MTERYRVAILGAGIGASHLEACLALPELFEVAVICDADVDRARPLANKAANAAIVSSVDQAIANTDIDLIDICLPPHLHADVAEQALASGKHVVCEKPVCGSLAQFDRLAARAEAMGRHLLPVFQYRHGVGIQTLRHLLTAGIPGRPLVAALETHWNRGGAYYKNPWRGRWAYELGGAVLSHAIHMHDLLTWLLGPVRRVFARTATRVNNIETEDCAAISLEMASGALITHSITLGAAEELSRLRLCFADLTVENEGRFPYDPGAGQWRFLPRGDGVQQRIDTEMGEFQPGPTGFTGLFAHIHAALASDSIAMAMQQAGRQSIELGSAIYLSAATEQDVGLPLSEDNPAYDGWDLQKIGSKTPC